MKKIQPSSSQQEAKLTLEDLPSLVLEKINMHLNSESQLSEGFSSKTLRDQATNWTNSIFSLLESGQYVKFIEKNPDYRTNIKSLYLSADVTNHIFPFPKDYVDSSPFRFFSQIKAHFPKIQNIYLELKHLYMLDMMIKDPDFKSSVHLVKHITTKTLAFSSEILDLMKTKYGEGQENILAISDVYNYLLNSNLTREVLKKFGKFTALNHLSLSPSGAIRCDYEDLNQLLGQLPDLRILELNLESDLTLDHTRLHSSDGAKPYHVMIEPPEDLESYSNRTIRYPLKDYPKITTLTLSGNYLPDIFLSYFSNLKHLTIDNSLSDCSSDKDLANKALRLLANVTSLDELVSLQIPASIPRFSNDDPPILDFQASSLNQLAKMIKLEKITITSPKDCWKKDTKVTLGESLFLKDHQDDDYQFPRVRELNIHYGQYHTYYSGTLNKLSQSFPNLLNLIVVKENSEQTVASGENSINEDKLITELQEVLKKNLWKNIKIHLHNFSFSEDIKSLFPNAEFSENKQTISIGSHKEEQAITSKFFSAVSVSSSSTSVTEVTEPKEDLVTKPVKK